MLLLLVCAVNPTNPSLTTINDVIVDQSGAPVTIKGLAWYGFGNPEIGQVEVSTLVLSSPCSSFVQQQYSLHVCHEYQS
jgi:hypothetical protein